MLHVTYHPGLGAFKDKKLTEETRKKRAQLLLQGPCLSRMIPYRGYWCGQIDMATGPFRNDLFLSDGMPSWANGQLAQAVKSQEDMYQSIVRARPYWVPLKLLLEVVAEPATSALGLSYETIDLDWHTI